jgi:hypothetical protein
MNTMARTEIDIELLLTWAYRDELSKRSVSAAEGIWDRIQENQHHGGIDHGHGAAQRYAHFGLPDPDAERIERAVSNLEELVIDWEQSFDTIAAELSGLISVNDVSPNYARKREAKVRWGEAGSKALKVFFGEGNERQAHDRPRDILMVGGIKTGVLVTMHAIKGTRPDWQEDDVRPGMVPHSLRESLPTVHGNCEGKNRYSAGSYCPLKWSPSPLNVVTSRADYAAWHQGLCTLASTLQLAKFIALPPKAPATPWIENDEPKGNVIPVMPTVCNHVSAWGTLPLHPIRGRKGAPLRQAKAGPVRYPLACTGL